MKPHWYKSEERDNWFLGTFQYSILRVHKGLDGIWRAKLLYDAGDLLVWLGTGMDSEEAAKEAVEAEANAFANADWNIDEYKRRRRTQCKHY